MISLSLMKLVLIPEFVSTYFCCHTAYRRVNLSRTSNLDYSLNFIEHHIEHSILFTMEKRII